MSNELSDFTNAPRRNFTYSGANGMKIAIWLDEESWFLKLPPQSTKTAAQLSYRNSCISEYLGCHVFALAGIPVQETQLGIFTHKGTQKIVVACKDFCTDGFTLGDFIGVKNAAIDSPHSGHDTELSTIKAAIEEQTFVDPDLLMERFWDVFVIDALIANNDRHNGNWGILNNGFESHIAPVFDCGSCLFPDADENLMRVVLNDPRQLNAYVFNKPTSAIKLNGQRLPYFDFMEQAHDQGLKLALKRIVPLLDDQELQSLIDETPLLTETQRAFYKTILIARKNRILDFYT